MSYYKKHLFFCTNQRANNKACCASHHAEDMRAYLKQKLKNLKMSGPTKFRVSSSGCLGRCKEGPVMVVYPDNIWYSYKTIKDIDEIVESHLVHGCPVKRLLLKEYSLES